MRLGVVDKNQGELKVNPPPEAHLRVCEDQYLM